LVAIVVGEEAHPKRGKVQRPGEEDDKA
jgi:hypothetical protein